MFCKLGRNQSIPGLACLRADIWTEQVLTRLQEIRQNSKIAKAVVL